MYVSSIVHFLLSVAPKIDNVDISEHDSVYYFATFFFRNLEDVEQQAIIDFYDEKVHRMASLPACFSLTDMDGYRACGRRPERIFGRNKTSSSKCRRLFIPKQTIPRNAPTRRWCNPYAVE
ncbi:hypothetical protein CNL05755 [Cryptococcus deneoformans JEC21]|uniref:Uncharacterized protein n=1 Tax=Cryptococcus deneoformans (strain JEC21 / ATCC MYA-565) TaxID=214684 RepID=A0A0S2M646_CRYD1|nr:hypothetical protein CNL05755 [Cryptococcus neoformans var. neoformans JEC21]ALO69699.1 hypothetical protein CNL05755 [Cryptococcus neoformans var. neoformans JEC21]